MGWCSDFGPKLGAAGGLSRNLGDPSVPTGSGGLMTQGHQVLSTRYHCNRMLMCGPDPEMVRDGFARAYGAEAPANGSACQ
jgi:hypothetical protein